MKPSEFKVHILPIFEDNYVFILEHLGSREVVVVDPGDAEPVLQLLQDHGWTLNKILVTHHHQDHVGGVRQLKETTKCTVIGPRYDQHRIMGLDQTVEEGDTVSFYGLDFKVWHVPGHTTGHIAYVSEAQKIVFSGDVLFGQGCGRVFEGTTTEMFQSLCRFKALDPMCSVYCTHEYTLKNAEFCCIVYPDNKELANRLLEVQGLRAQGIKTVPLTLGQELKTNPFLLARDPTDFGTLRAKRNVY